MATVVDEFPANAREFHDWDRYLDGQKWRLVHGEDFRAKPGSLRTSAGTNARRRGGYIESHLTQEGGEVVLYLQFFKGKRPEGDTRSTSRGRVTSSGKRAKGKAS